MFRSPQTRGQHSVLTLSSPKSAFLGDAEFPKSAERLVKGGRIRLYEFVYKQYSTLAFSLMTDRSVAISGLEKRLIRTFNTTGGYGVFTEYLDRSLLWQRASNEMNRIQYPAWRKVPSWSWMAYDGRITYVDIPFGKVDWLHQVQSPFERDATNNQSEVVDIYANTPPIDLSAIAWNLSPHSAGSELTSVVFDQHGMKTLPGLKCVVVAKDRYPGPGELRKLYVLVIAPRTLDGFDQTFERVGAGFVEEGQIDFRGPRSFVNIQ